jgi:hypothetical protein
MGFKALKEEKFETARKIYEALINQPGISIRQMAMEAACLASALEMLGEKEKSIDFFARSAISDEVSVVREYTSLIRLAQLLFEMGDLERSNLYINLALEDANFFGSRQRKIQILEVLPLIKAQQLGLIKQKRDQWIIFTSLLLVLLIGCIWLIIRNIRQTRHIRLNENRLEQLNHDLERKKKDLEEAQIIKEEYIGHFFQSNTRIINKIEKIFKEIEKGAAEKKVADIKFQLSQFKPEIEKKRLLKEFDKAFLSIFPNFVKDINELLDEGQQFSNEDDFSLNTELRIFALIRMGLINNELIARTLGYSVNTVYTYKTKMRNKSNLSSEEFDKAIRNIQSVRND